MTILRRLDLRVFATLILLYYVQIESTDLKEKLHKNLTFHSHGSWLGGGWRR